MEMKLSTEKCPEKVVVKKMRKTVVKIFKIHLLVLYC